MIVFDLGCDHGHVFEAWFGSSDDYEQQRTRGLVACPLCGSLAINKAPMTPNVGRKGNQLQTASSQPKSTGNAITVANEPSPPSNPEEIKAMLGALAKAQGKMLEGSEYVGPGFAEAARAMHLGEIEQHSIHGQASLEEAKSLVEEGVSVMPLPFPVLPPGSTN